MDKEAKDKEASAANPLPPHMRKGSRGPAVVPLLAFLAGDVINVHSIAPGFRNDDVYGECAVKLMMDYQASHGLKVDGDCNLETRKFFKMAKCFDFELAARLVGGTTLFVQPDGTEISWSAGPQKTMTFYG
jgi:murein L,D-transpeptidase YcbB/YkuD